MKFILSADFPWGRIKKNLFVFTKWNLLNWKFLCWALVLYKPIYKSFRGSLGGRRGRYIAIQSRQGALTRIAVIASPPPGAIHRNSSVRKIRFLGIFWSISYFLYFLVYFLFSTHHIWPMLLTKTIAVSTCLSINTHQFFHQFRRLGLNDITPSDDHNGVVVGQNPIQHVKKKSLNWFKKE